MLDSGKDGNRPAYPISSRVSVGLSPFYHFTLLSICSATLTFLAYFLEFHCFVLDFMHLFICSLHTMSDSRPLELGIENPIAIVALIALNGFTPNDSRQFITIVGYDG